MKPPTEAALRAFMRAAQAGDNASYDRLLRQIAPLLRAVVRHQRPYLKREDIEDLVQDVLISMHSVRSTYDPGREFLPWLMAIARNRMSDSGRRHLRRAAHEIQVEELPVTYSDLNENVDADVYGDPEALRKAISQLPEGQQRAVEMLKLREMSLKEAALASGASVGALKVSVHRAIVALRKMLAGD